MLKAFRDEFQQLRKGTAEKPADCAPSLLPSPLLTPQKLQGMFWSSGAP